MLTPNLPNGALATVCSDEVEALVEQVRRVAVGVDGLAPEVDEASALAPLAASLVELERALARAQRDRDETCDLQRTRDAQIQQVRKMQALSLLAGAIAHDFNNLLTVIMIHADFLIEELPPESQALQDAQAVQATTEKAQRLTRQLVAIGQPKADVVRPIDLKVLLSEVATAARELVAENISVGVDFCAGDCTTATDPTLMRQALENLIYNARDAMPNGGTLRIATERIELDAEQAQRIVGLRPGTHLRIIVADTGVGMTEDVLIRAFEPFYTTKDRTKVAGLGLTSVFGVVNRSHGAVRLESQPGQGTTASIYLPHSVDRAKRVATSEGPSRPLAGVESVLLVEDQTSVREVLKRLLSENGYEVLVAADGAEALVIAEKHPGPIDLLLTDIIMPNVNGWEVAERMGRLRPATRVLFISGYTDELVPADALGDGGLRLLKKPFTRQELLRAVREVLDR